MLSTKDEKKPDKKEILAAMKLFHQPTFDGLGIKDPFFICKLAYKPAGKEENIIAFFHSEISKGVDIYVEFGDAVYNPQDPERRLYVYRYNPHYTTEYEMVESGGIIRYLVPVSDLKHVKNNPPEDIAKSVIKKEEPELMNAFEQMLEEDIPLKDASVRDLLAVIAMKPVSKHEWLNQLIRNIEAK